MQGSQVIVLATPVFLLLIAFEWWAGIARGRDTYRLNDAMNSIGLGVMSELVGVFTRLMKIALYALLFDHVALWQLPADAWWVWLAALVMYDFLYYWKHRAGHRVALFWAAHVVHHQSEEYNLSTALRQTSSDWIAGWIFYLPMAVLGIPPLVFAVVALVDLLYQFWPHTRQIGKLGWFDRWFCSPSNHRVHHAVNDKYLDRNYGGILIIWDRMFGSFQEEDDAEPCVYGTRKPLRSWNPLWANLQVYADLARASRRARGLAGKLRVWLAPPGWQPAGEAAAQAGPAFDPSAQRRYDPPTSRATLALAAALFGVLLAATSAFLWSAHTLPTPTAVGLAAGIIAGLWGVGRLLEPRARTEAAPTAG